MQNRVVDEVSLLRRSLHGDSEAWGEIVRRYKEAVFGIALGILRHHADAEDATHDAFIRAYDNLRRYKLEKKFSTWLFAIVANICKNKLRYHRYHPVVSAGHQIEEMAPGFAVTIELEERLRDALTELPVQYRAPLVLHYWNDLTYKEIAEILSTPEGTIKTHIHRAKVALKQKLDQREVIKDASR
ncbi:sigma-70 family RNA polymerase sigma factor [Candidatus Acetothermia bacterium]|nr:sigma-70 family RNA polymerase sigma factor [Candidatus Acetothermia bacterium]